MMRRVVSNHSVLTLGPTSPGTAKTLGVCVLLAAAAGLTACSPPQGSSGARIPVSETTPAERRDRAVQPSDLASSSDVVAQALAADIQRLADEDFGGYRVAVKFGDIENKTTLVPTTDFEYVRDRIRSKLMTSRTIRENVKFLEGRQRVERINQREMGDSGDLLNEGRNTARPTLPNPEYTFYLNGNMYQVTRGSGQSATDLYYMKYQLTRASDGEIVFEQDYEVKYGIAR